jgi:acyl dehydratase
MTLDLALVGKSTDTRTHAYTWKDTVLYALGIGAKLDELDYLFEGRGPKVHPSFAVVPTFAPLFELLTATKADLAMIVHGGQRVRVHAPIPPSGTFHTTAKIRGIYDLRRLATVVVDTQTTSESGTPLFDTVWTIIVRNGGGFGGDPPPRDDKETGVNVPKDRAPDFRVEEATTKEQALLYRLSGDLNPLHADPDFAKSVGFEQGPILHGLCTYGFMVRHVAKGACGGDPSKLTAFEASFRKPVWPGDTLVTEGWTVAPGKLALSVRVKERDEAVVTGWASTAV